MTALNRTNFWTLPASTSINDRVHHRINVQNSVERGNHPQKQLYAPDIGNMQQQYNDYYNHQNGSTHLSGDSWKGTQKNRSISPQLIRNYDKISYQQKHNPEMFQDSGQCQNMTYEQLCSFRTQVCPKKAADDNCFLKDSCPFSHCLSWHRRNPKSIKYRPTLCPNVVFWTGPMKNMRVTSHCPRGRLCTYSHTKEEQMYHPLVYKTQICRDWPNCFKQFCPFAHGGMEQRVHQSCEELQNCSLHQNEAQNKQNRRNRNACRNESHDNSFIHYKRIQSHASQNNQPHQNFGTSDQGVASDLSSFSTRSSISNQIQKEEENSDNNKPINEKKPLCTLQKNEGTLDKKISGRKSPFTSIESMNFHVSSMTKSTLQSMNREFSSYTEEKSDNRNFWSVSEKNDFQSSIYDEFPNSEVHWNNNNDYAEGNNHSLKSNLMYNHVQSIGTKNHGLSAHRYLSSAINQEEKQKISQRNFEMAEDWRVQFQSNDGSENGLYTNYEQSERTQCHSQPDSIQQHRYTNKIRVNHVDNFPYNGQSFSNQNQKSDYLCCNLYNQHKPGECSKTLGIVQLDRKDKKNLQAFKSHHNEQAQTKNLSECVQEPIFEEDDMSSEMSQISSMKSQYEEAFRSINRLNSVSGKETQVLFSTEIKYIDETPILDSTKTAPSTFTFSHSSKSNKVDFLDTDTNDNYFSLLGLAPPKQLGLDCKSLLETPGSLYDSIMHSPGFHSEFLQSPILLKANDDEQSLYLDKSVLSSKDERFLSNIEAHGQYENCNRFERIMPNTTHMRRFTANERNHLYTCKPLTWPDRILYDPAYQNTDSMQQQVNYVATMDNHILSTPRSQQIRNVF